MVMGGKRFIHFREFLVDNCAVGPVLIASTIFFVSLYILPAPQLTAYLITLLTSIGCMGILSGIPVPGIILRKKYGGLLAAGKQ